MNKIKRLKNLELEIRRLAPDLVGPIAAKVVIDEAYNSFFEILDEITEILKDEEFVPKSLIKIIIYIHLTVNAEANYVDTDSKLFMTAAKLDDKVINLLGDFAI